MRPLIRSLSLEAGWPRLNRIKLTDDAVPASGCIAGTRQRSQDARGYKPATYEPTISHDSCRQQHRRGNQATGPALGMFEVFGRTGPPILGGAILDPKIFYKLTCQFERLWCLDYDANTDINDVEWNWVFFHFLYWGQGQQLLSNKIIEGGNNISCSPIFL